MPTEYHDPNGNRVQYAKQIALSLSDAPGDTSRAHLGTQARSLSQGLGEAIDAELKKLPADWSGLATFRLHIEFEPDRATVQRGKDEGY